MEHNEVAAQQRLQNRFGGWARRFAIGGLMGAGVAWFGDPARTIARSGSLIVLVSDRCGHSMSVLSQLEERAELRDAVVPPPVHPTDGASAVACGLASAHLRNVAPRFELFPDHWLCNRLSAHAHRLRVSNSGLLPAWFDESRELRGIARTEVFEGRGLRLDTNAHGTWLRLASDPVDPLEQPDAAVSPESPQEWRGLPVGW